MTKHVNVVVIRDGVVNENYLFVGDDAGTKAEEKAVGLCYSYIWNFDEYTQHDIDASLEDGYFMFGNDSICISHPEINDEIVDDVS